VNVHLFIEYLWINDDFITSHRKILAVFISQSSLDKFFLRVIWIAIDNAPLGFNFGYEHIN